MTTRETTSFVYVTYIRSTPQKVFEAIVKPEIARRYWGHENVSDWNPGSKWEHIRANDQRTVELVGKVAWKIGSDSPGTRGCTSDEREQRPTSRSWLARRHNSALVVQIECGLQVQIWRGHLAVLWTRLTERSQSSPDTIPFHDGRSH